MLYFYILNAGSVLSTITIISVTQEPILIWFDLIKCRLPWIAQCAGVMYNFMSTQTGLGCGDSSRHHTKPKAERDMTSTCL